MKSVDLDMRQVEEMSELISVCHDQGVNGSPGMIVGQVLPGPTGGRLKVAFIPHHVAIEIQEVLFRHSIAGTKPGTTIF